MHGGAQIKSSYRPNSCNGLLVGLITMILEDAFGSRPVLVVSTSVAGVGLLLVPMATSVIHIALALTCLVGKEYQLFILTKTTNFASRMARKLMEFGGVFPPFPFFCFPFTSLGPGMGITGVLAKSILGRHFINHYTLACGISHAGTALSLLVFAPMMQLFLDTYGWRGATLLFAGIVLHQVASSVRVRVRQPLYQPLQDASDGTASQHTDDPSAIVLLTRVAKAMDLGLLREFNFWTAFLCVCGARLANDFWMVFYVPHLQVKGISPQLSAWLCSAAAIGYICGTVVFVPFINRGMMKCSTGVIIASLVSSVCLVVDPWINGIPALAAITFIFGLALSSLFTLADVLTKDLVGSDWLTSAIGWMAFLCGFSPDCWPVFYPVSHCRH